VQRKERTQLVEIDVCDNLLFGHSEVLREPARAEQSLLFAGEYAEKYGATIADPFIVRSCGTASKLHQQRNIICVIKRAVVETVAVHRFAVAVAIQVGGDDHVFVIQLWVIAPTNGQYVLR